MIFIKKFLLGILLIGCLAFTTDVALAGFGVSPPVLLNENLLPGSSYEQIIYLVRSEPKESLSAKVVITADNFSNWITIVNGNEFEIPEGIQQFPMKIKVNVPSDALLGFYEGKIRIDTKSLSKEPQKDPIKVAYGGNVSIKLRVTSDKVSDYSIQSMYIEDAPQNLPLNLSVKVWNKGNILNGPNKAKIIIYDIYHKDKLWEGEEIIAGKVGSFSMGDVFVKFPNTLEMGQYWAEINLFDEKGLAHQDELVFNVIEPVPVKNNNFLIIGSIIGLVIIVLVIFIVSMIIKRNKKNNI